MKKIVLCCSFGMSTSMLVNKMQNYLESINEKVEIVALPVEKVIQGEADADVVLLGPQVKFRLKEVKEKHPDLPCDVIPMIDYGRMNGENVVKFAKKLVGED